MVISDKFIWLHFPKCSGTETERLLRLNFGTDSAVTFDPIDPQNVIWHQSVAKRRVNDKNFKVIGKDIICNFRRLPSWLLSRVHFEYWRNPQHKVSRSMFLKGQFYEENGRVNSADFYVKHYSVPKVTHWIRTEYLAEDFISVFSRYLDVSNVDVKSQIKITNAVQVKYITNLDFFFSTSELAHLYELNPLWAATEKEVYGDILRI